MNVSDAVKITNMVMTGAGEGCNLFRDRQCRVKVETEIFGKTGWALWVEWKGRRERDWLFWRFTDEKEFCFRGI